MNNYERKQLEFKTEELLNKVYNQCLQEVVKLTFTLNITKSSGDSLSDVTTGSSSDDASPQLQCIIQCISYIYNTMDFYEWKLNLT